MAEDNYGFVRDVLNELKSGLGPYIIRAFADHFGDERNVHLARLKSALSSERTYRSIDFESNESVLRQIDIAGWLKVMRLRWDPVFKDKLGEEADSEDTNVLNSRAYVRELITGRNQWGHETDENQITLRDALRISGTAERLLLAVESAELADSVRLKTEEFVQKTSIADTETVEVDYEAIKHVDLSGLNLSNMDLRCRNLHLAKLQGADLSSSNSQYEYLADTDLSNAKLVGTDLSEANLDGANLSHADLSSARLQWSNLKNCNMTHATLVKANLHMAEIDGADFSNADMTGVDMHNPKSYDLDSGKRVILETLLAVDDHELFDYLSNSIAPSDLNFSDAILRRANMQRAWLEFNVTLTRADMTEANCFGSRIAANLAGAILSRANLSKCWILSSDFSGAKMDGIVLSGSECVYTKFANAHMSGAKMHNFTIGDHDDGIDDSWDNVNLSEADLSDAILTHLSIRNANLTGAIFNGSQLSFANFSNADLKETDFTGADLTCADFTSARFYPFSTILPDGTYWDEDTDMTRFTGPLNNC